MRPFLMTLLYAAGLMTAPAPAAAASALQVLGRDYAFPNKIDGLPAKLSDFKGLQINFFTTSDGVRIAYWEAGKGDPLIFVPGWSANGAEYINVMYLLSQHYHVYVMDPRNQGLSQRVEYGGRIARFAMDLKELSAHLGLKKANYAGWSMGASVLWSYIDLFGTDSINKAIFVDEPISIYSHQDWSEQERQDAGGTTTSAERMVAGFTGGAPLNALVTDLRPWERAQAMDSPYYVNSEGFAQAFIKNDPKAVGRVLFDHVTNDWRDVIKHKVDIPVAIFSGEYSNNLPSQRWMQRTLPQATLHVYSRAEQGDHFLMFKNPVKSTTDLRAFLERGTPSATTRTTMNNSPTEKAAGTASTAEPVTHTETLVKSTTSWNGVPYARYGKGQPELTVLKFEFPPHTELPWHRHVVPNAAYVISGHLNIQDRETGETRRFEAGQAFTEQVGPIHRGFTDTEPAVVIATYAGFPGAPLSIHEDGP